MAFEGFSSIVGIANHIKFNYSNIKGSVDKVAKSPIFLVGGHEWLINCYYQGSNDEAYVSLFLGMPYSSEGVSGIFELYLLDKCGKPSSITWRSSSLYKIEPGHGWYVCPFIKKADLEADYIDTERCFVVVCVIKLEGESYKQVSKKRSFMEISQFDMNEDMSNLLENEEMSDVTFQVGEESFDAHKLILAARSRVFKAELFGSMSESGTEMKSITIKDMQPDVFKAMLHFIYTDSPPNLGDEKTSVLLVQHLLAAADRYCVERLKVICEKMLCRRISFNTVVSMLALAERHNCVKLKNACLGFVVVPKNRVDLSLNKEYLELILSSPSLLAEIQARVGKK